MPTRVAILKDTDRRNLNSNVKKAVGLIGGISTVVKPGDSVLIKPNVLCGLKAETGATVCPEVIEALVELCRDAGAGSVIIAEASNWGIDTLEAFRACGYDELARRCGVRLLDLKKDEQREVAIDDPVHHSIFLPRTVFDVDVVIDVPVLKTHNQTIVSISLKNLAVGTCSDKMKKSRIHSIGLNPPLPEEFRGKGSELDYMIAAVSKALPCRLVVVDGFYGMHGFGSPIKGQPANAGLVVAGADRVAVDTICSQLIGVDPQQVPHISLAAAKGIGTMVPAEIEVLGESIDKAATKFQGSIIEDISGLAPENVHIVNHNACYSCVSNLGYFLKQHSQELKEIGPVTFVIGKTPADSHQKHRGKIVYYGNCAGLEMYGGGFVPGCVPRSRRQIFEALGIGDRYKSYEW